MQIKRFYWLSRNGKCMWCNHGECVWCNGECVCNSVGGVGGGLFPSCVFPFLILYFSECLFQLMLVISNKR